MAWGFADAPVTYLIPNDAFVSGPALTISGIISPGTPLGTKITSTSSVDINVNAESGGSWENQYTGATDTSVVMVTPEYPSPALPAALVLGLIGTVFMVRNRKKFSPVLSQRR